MSTFNFEPAPFIPFRDKEVISRCRNIKREEITKHPNKDFKIKRPVSEASILASNKRRHDTPSTAFRHLSL